MRATTVLGFAMVLGCGPSEEDFVPKLAESYCKLQTACDCSGALAHDACVESVASLITVPSSAGLTYDAGCAGEIVAAYERLECERAGTLIGTLGVDECDVCKPYHGAKGGGESCDVLVGYSVYDDCDQGLLCFQARCVDPCSFAGAGEGCVGRVCDEGLSCVFRVASGDATCQPPGGSGASCAEIPCDEGLACDPDAQTCEPAPGTGEACVDVCAEGSWCDSGVCEDTKPNGESCVFNNECASGACDPYASGCAEPEPLACSS